jgi:hypothetical protein
MFGSFGSSTDSTTNVNASTSFGSTSTIPSALMPPHTFSFGTFGGVFNMSHGSSDTSIGTSSPSSSSSSSSSTGFGRRVQSKSSQNRRKVGTSPFLLSANETATATTSINNIDQFPSSPAGISFPASTASIASMAASSTNGLVSFTFDQYSAQSALKWLRPSSMPLAPSSLYTNHPLPPSVHALTLSMIRQSLVDALPITAIQGIIADYVVGWRISLLNGRGSIEYVTLDLYYTTPPLLPSSSSLTPNILPESPLVVGNNTWKYLAPIVADRETDGTCIFGQHLYLVTLRDCWRYMTLLCVQLCEVLTSLNRL